MTSNALRRWTTVHRWFSLFVTLNLLILSVTGLFLIFHEEIEHALGTVPEVEAVGQMKPLGEIVEAAKVSRPGWTPMTFAEDEEHPGMVFVAMCPPGPKDFALAKGILLNGYTAQLLDVDLEKTLTRWVFDLHANLFMGFAGELYLALVGLSFFVALISGVIIYAPFMRSLLFGELRRERGKRLFQLDLHNLVGIATLAWCSVVALTGVVLELTKPALGVYQMTDLAKMIEGYKDQPVPTQIVPIEKAQETAQAAWPGHRVSFALFPGTPLSGEHHYTFFMAASEGVAKRVLKLALVDASNGSLTVARESPWYIKALFISGPLHFGDYAGMPLKIIWALFTVLTIVLCVTGIYLFIARLRSRKRGEPTPEEEVLEEVAR